eukprot:TRINITY_DN25370_c0_g1_i1.p1 TRINITY_DN25370_c0_g1~~TRINITY_DN25370_c0_g1_i1.p1  ORF type:complete len:301 (+),score=64.24 TRINITY_DN25370_c0_g1_i1:151-1053(+)
MIRRPPRSTLSSSSAASDVYKRQEKKEQECALEEVKEAKSELDSQVRELKETLTGTEERLKALQSELDQQTKLVTEAHSEASRHKEKAIKSAEEGLLLSETKVQAEAEAKRVCMQLQATEQSLQKTLTDLDTLRAAQKNADATTKERSRELESCKHQLKTADLDLSKRSKELESLQTKYKQTELSLQASNMDLAKLEREVGRLTASLEEEGRNKLVHPALRTPLGTYPLNETIKKRDQSPEKTQMRLQSSVSYTHLRAHETPEHLVCRLLLEKKKMTNHKTEVKIYRFTNTETKNNNKKH